ncbi:MAG: MerR family transcriptional regulator [Steroidobacteraceae bacterium]
MSALLTIQSAANEVGVSPNTLRVYERLGFLTPVRDSAGRRLFSAADVARARRIAKQRSGSRGSGLRGQRPTG